MIYPTVSKKSSKISSEPHREKRLPLRIDPLYSSHIQGRVHIGKELKQRKLSEQATKGKELIRDVHKVSLCPQYLVEEF